ncbi:MAG: hypothetical protein ACI4I9_07890 [Porcipelethomonas sp.]
MKEKYFEAEMEIVEFDCEGVIKSVGTGNVYNMMCNIFGIACNAADNY